MSRSDQVAAYPFLNNYFNVQWWSSELPNKDFPKVSEEAKKQIREEAVQAAQKS